MWFSVGRAEAARIFLFPASQEIRIGNTLISEIRLDTEGETINVGTIELVYQPRLLKIIDVVTGGSIFSLFPQSPTVDETQGTISLQGGIPQGFAGAGVIGKIMFQAERVGVAKVSFSRESQILLHDGKGTESELTFASSEYRIVASASSPQIVLTSEDHPQENRWYVNPFIRMNWEVKEGASYSYVLSRSRDEIPDEIADEPVGDIKLATNEDGVFYFHLRECVGGICGETLTRQVLKDSTPPEPFEAQVGTVPTLYEGKRFISFAATDATSGIDHYEIREGSSAWRVVVSPFVPADQSFKQGIEVRAIDKAGNERIAVVAPPEAQLTFVDTAGIVVAVVVLLLIFYLWKRRNP
ncbi:MAG: hypothetical protein HY459_03000 [Parcubacteria group bacterium]|nr:hypothetical protein [Parcubacteria group bacterium]